MLSDKPKYFVSCFIMKVSSVYVQMSGITR